ncbi:MAG: hypothetical protein ACOCV4_01285 [Myxococcota bacterium]
MTTNDGPRRCDDSSRRRRAVASLAVLVVAATSAVAEAKMHPVERSLHIAGDGRCFEQETLASQVAHWLDRDDVDARFEVVVVPAAGPDDPVEFRIVEHGKVVSRRRFSHPPSDCAQLQASVGLAIALAIDRRVLERIAPAASRPEAQRSRGARRARRGAPERPPERGRRPPGGLAADVAVHGEAWLGLVPGGVVGVLDAGLAVRSARGLGARVGIVGSTERRTAIASGSARARLLAAGLEGCWRGELGPARLAHRACAGLAAGVLRGRGRGFGVASATAAPTWVAAVGRYALEWRIAGPLAIVLRGSLAAPIVRPRLVVKGPAGQVVAARTPSLVAGGAGLGLALDL